MNINLKSQKRRKLILVFFIGFISVLAMPLSAQQHAQKQKIKIEKNPISLRELFKTIEKQSDYLFFFVDSDIEGITVISLSEKPIFEILDAALKNAALTYTVSDRHITISKKQNKANETENRKKESRKISGKVVDDKRTALPGVTVSIPGSTKGVITDIDGSFSIETSSDKLSFSFIGMDSQTVDIGSQTVINVTMKEKTSLLNEVTVVAYGTQKRESVIGAISSVSIENLKLPAGKVSTSLAGQMAGIVSVQSTGEPGESANFWIRGVSTFGAHNKPLILVDGIERDLDLVDAEDIESFSILKDATATAVYGVRGANGIVLITTKKGKESLKPNIRGKVEYGIMSPVKLPKLADASQWIDYFNDISYDNSGLIPIPNSEKEKYLNGYDPDLYPNVDWMRTVFRSYSPNMKAGLNITGGGKKYTYYISGNYYREEGMYNPIKNPNYNSSVAFNRFSFRSNIEVDITNSTKLTLNLANQYDTRNRLGENHNTLWTGILQTPNISLPIIYSDGKYAKMKPSNSINPYYSLNFTGFSRDTWFNSQSLIGITQDFSELITKGLSMNVKFSWDAVNSNVIDQRKKPNTYYALGRDTNGNINYEETYSGSDYLSLSRTNKGAKTINFESSLLYENVFGIHRLGAMLLFSMREHNNDFPSDFIAAIPNRNIGLAGRVTYSFIDKYFFEGNFGYNGSENFAPKKRFGFFPSLAIGYLLSNESFFEDYLSVVHLLKLKSSYGLIGNDKIGGDRRFAFNTEMRDDDKVPGWIFGNTGQINYRGITTGYPGNPHVAWEEAKKFNAGIEFGLFNALTIQADYFFDRRDGIFIKQESVPSVVGNNIQQYVNLGRMQNQGIDASLEFYKKFGDLFVSARGNFTFNRNKKLYDDKPTPVWAYQEEVNEPLNQNRGLVALGLFVDDMDIKNSPSQSFFGQIKPGDIKYKDINGDRVINDYDKIAIGYSTIPELNYGFGASLNYKGIDVSVFFQGVGHVTKFIGGNSLYGGSGNYLVSGQILADVADGRWKLSNPDPHARYPRMSVSQNSNNRQPSTFFQRDMSFLRLKNMEFGYTIPKKAINRLGISDLRLYFLGVNLLTFSNFTLWDPESGGTNGGNYPQMRTLNLGMNVNF